MQAGPTPQRSAECSCGCVDLPGCVHKRAMIRNGSFRDEWQGVPQIGIKIQVFT